MAMHLHGGIGGRLGARPGSRRVYRKGLMSEINVTPFVDVMLVLLIIFMVTAPMMTSGIQVDLPEAAVQPLTGNDEPLVVSINKSGEVFIQNTKIETDKIAEKLKAIANNKSDTRIFVRGDKETEYGIMIKIMSTINNAGFTKVGLVTENISDGE